MASRLDNLFRTLQWSDYTTHRHSAAPGAGVAAMAAQTATSFTHNNLLSQVETVPGDSSHFRVKDDIVITIVFDPAQSWAEDWMLASSTAFQDRILNHEQGHYNITALLARDCFIDLMQLKSRTFSTRHRAQAALAGAFNPYMGQSGIVQAVQDLYDLPTQANHSRNAQGQTNWDGFIQTAFTQTRTPPVTSPDGVPYKVTLVSVLRGAGLTVP